MTMPETRPSKAGMRVRRSHCEVVQEMLTLCTAANTKTQIMHHANVSHSVMERYLADLEARDIIRHGEDARGYALTARGEELLRLLRRAHDLLYTPLEHAR